MGVQFCVTASVVSKIQLRATSLQEQGLSLLLLVNTQIYVDRQITGIYLKLHKSLILYLHFVRHCDFQPNSLFHQYQESNTHFRPMSSMFHALKWPEGRYAHLSTVLGSILMHPTSIAETNGTNVKGIKV
jgi:hypothetical protein